jgi:hypothetical protein
MMLPFLPLGSAPSVLFGSISTLAVKCLLPRIINGLGSSFFHHLRTLPSSSVLFRLLDLHPLLGFFSSYSTSCILSTLLLFTKSTLPLLFPPTGSFLLPLLLSSLSCALRFSFLLSLAIVFLSSFFSSRFLCVFRVGG